MSKRVLITGESGFIGSHLVKLLGRQAIPSGFVLSDDRAIRDTLARVNPDVVIHLAAISMVAQCEADPALAIKTNVGGTAAILKALAQNNQKPKFIFFSTAHVYDTRGSNSVVIDESHPIDPLNLYAKTKFEAEQLIEQYSSESGIPSTVLRVFNHVHHTQKQPTFLSSLYQELLSRKELGSVASIPVGNLDLFRDVGSVKDLLSAVMSIIAQKADCGFQVFNVCNGQKRKLRELAQHLARAVGVQCDFSVDPSRIRKVDPETIVGSHAKLTAAIGWSPKVKTDEELIHSFLEAL